MDIKKSWNKWRIAIYWAIAIIFSISIMSWRAPAVFLALSDKNSQNNFALTVAMIFMAAALLLILTFFLVFKGVKADEEKLNNIIVYCYAFLGFALAVSIVPFVIFNYIPGINEIMDKSPIGIVRGCSVSPVEAKGDFVPRELQCEKNTNQWVVNLGGLPMPPPIPDTTLPPLHHIQGGLVIPLYVVVLSLMGAAVSMTRRVPEYQRRLSPGDPSYMTYDQAREAMVFQIMQVGSAPLIAITMYYIVNPDVRATTIVLAFASGFSSETILLAIRALLEKLKPEPQSVNVKPTMANVQISPARLDFGDAQINSKVMKGIVIENPTALDLDVTGAACTGEFRVITEFPQKAKPGASINVQILFEPKTAGSKTGELSVTDNAPGSPRSVDLTGTGI